ncbi:MAG: tRNA uracil 4-sulfurtransferase ThiI, partial [Erysipelotrichaceae bacterium]
DHILIELNNTDSHKVMDALSHVFGISNYALAYGCAKDINSIIETCVTLMQDAPICSFKVDTRRKDKSFPILSNDVSMEVGHAILNTSQHRVDIHHPQRKIRIDIEDRGVFVCIETIEGKQGFPVSTMGEAIMLLSGGIDSPVAAYLAMKRGVHIKCIHFVSPPYTSEQALDKVKALIKILNQYQAKIDLYVIPFTEIQLEIYKKADHSYAITIMRRMMLRMAEQIANRDHITSIITGESIGQVASQTLESMLVITAAQHLNILRPLITYDKNEIIALAKTIKTYETSILPFEDCCTIFKVNSPVTKPRLYFVEHEEQRCDFTGMIQTALEQTQLLSIENLVEDFL